MRKGIILAGGSGTRLQPLTLGASKQLLPVYDKPLIYYPLSTLMLAGIRDVLIISTPQDLPRFQTLLGDGGQLGMRFQYAEQPRPEGLAQAFIIGRDFIGRALSALVLGDNIFYGGGLRPLLEAAAKRTSGATVFAYHVRDPERYGLYFFDNAVLDIAANLRPSARGELEITDVNAAYLRKGTLHVSVLSRGIAWLDTGNPDALLQAANYVAALEQRQGLKVGAIEEVAWRMGFIDAAQVERLAAPLGANPYGEYLRAIIKEKD